MIIVCFIAPIDYTIEISYTKLSVKIALPIANSFAWGSVLLNIGKLRKYAKKFNFQKFESAFKSCVCDMCTLALRLLVCQAVLTRVHKIYFHQQA